MSAWSSVIDLHVAKLRSGDKKLFDRVDAFFLGKPWAQTDVGASEAELIKTSTNFVFPIVETATSVLIPPNPQVSLNPRAPMEPVQVETGEGIVNYSLDEGRWRDELTVVVQNVVKYGRGPVKTTWDADKDLPVTRFIDPRSYFYDETAVRHEDCRYEIEATILSKRDMEKRVKEDMYPSSVLSRRDAERYPAWLLPDNKNEIDSLKNYQPWYLVWEVHDREAGKVLHLLPGEDDPILDDDLVFRPYDLLTFNHNGKNIGGISEIGLILPNQEEYNWTETFLLNILRFGVPGILYDSAVGTTDEMQKMSQAPLGALFPVKVPSNKVLAETFFQRPLPPYPPLANDMLARKREGISYVSAMSDAMRSQTVGAKTATELAFIEGNTRNRLRPRQSKVDALTERIAEKHLLLASRYMRTEKVVQITGTGEWKRYSPFDLEGVTASFKIVAYSPMETNKAVKVETLRNIQPLVVGNPWVKQREFTAELFKLMDMPDGLIYTAEELAQQQAATAPPALDAPPSPGGPGADIPPAVAPAPAEASALPPRGAGMSDAVATPVSQESMPP